VSFVLLLRFCLVVDGFFGVLIMRLLGVDPGLQGALAFYDIELASLLCVDMPIIRTRNKTQLIDAEIVSSIRSMRPDAAVVELVHAMPKQGVTSTFNFGVGFGVLRGILATLEIPVSFLTPQEWRRVVHVQGIAGDKGASRLRAMQLFPKQSEQFARVKDHGRADAALIAYAFLTLHKQL
jgi:crossover junction endodeoxyribonuclease RuvC